MDSRKRDRFTRRIQQRGILRKAQRKRRVNKNLVFNRKIDKRKYYGVAVNISNYTEIIEEGIDFSELKQYLSTLRETKVTESYIDQAKGLVKNLFDTGIAVKIKDLFIDSHKKGTRRVFDKKGEQIDIGDVEPRGIEHMTAKQKEYFSNISSDAGETIDKELTKSLEKGESIPKARDKLMDKLEGLKKNRAETIARSEIIKASAKGTEDAMEDAGINKVLWVATLDARVCEVCEALHLKQFSRGETLPVRDTHPNCRCTLVADV